MVNKARTLTDDEVIANLRDNRQVDETIRFLYREYYDFVSRYVVQNSGRAEDAQDMFQEVIIAFISVVQRGKFRGEASIKTFLYTMNRNMWLNEIKKRDRAHAREQRYEKLAGSGEAAAPDFMEQREVHNELMKSMEAIGDTCRQILLLFYYENRSMKEILATLHYENEQVVRNKKSKCMKKLEELIRGNNNLYLQLKTILHG
ncbi:MAG TPA: sigma-70 family RNA polymerase sigma factor [Flavisolibacter sp.]